MSIYHTTPRGPDSAVGSRKIRQMQGEAAWALAAVIMIAGLFTGACSASRPARDRAVQPSEAGAGKHEQASVQLPPGAIWVETLDLDGVEQEWARPRAGRSVEGNSLTLDGLIYTHGIGTHANSEMIIDLKGVARRFEAVVGVDDETEGAGSVAFVVWVDNQEVRRTGVLRGGDPPETVSVDLTDARQMTLVVENAGDGIHSDHADWALAMLVLVPGAEVQPAVFVLPPGPEPQIASHVSEEPAIHAPRITGATPGRPFLFRIPATGTEPLRFTAKNLPDGLVLDPETGIISGSLAAEGTTQVGLTVEGPRGIASSTLTIVGGKRALALTPPMGWNSWNVWGTSVDEAKVRDAADWMVKSGLAACGYQYINIDDAWEGERDTDGRIQTNEKFPDMKALADYVHGKGLKLGIYSSPGPTTCAGYEGSYGYERLDAETYAAWGIDLLKYDWCSYRDLAKDDGEEELRKPYEIMRKALDDCGRDIVYSLCQYGMGDVSRWGKAVGGNYWRTTGDIWDSWARLSAIGFGQDGLEVYAEPGHWNDPDMLVVGKVGWGPDLHGTKLTPNEQVTHMILWSLLAAPLLIGCDLSQLDDFTLALLTNPEVLEVNQDPLGKQARRVAAVDRLEVWARPLADGSLAVGLFNRTRGEATVTVNWTDLGLLGPQPVRDLWLRQDQGSFDSAYSTEVSRHGAVILKIGVGHGNGAQTGTR